MGQDATPSLTELLNNAISEAIVKASEIGQSDHLRMGLLYNGESDLWQSVIAGITSNPVRATECSTPEEAIELLIAKIKEVAS